MSRRMLVLAVALVLILPLGLWSIYQGPVTAVQQDSDVAVEAPEPQAGLFSFSGGPVRAKRARTQSAPSTIGETANWVSLSNAVLQYVVPAGTTDLFNVSFSAECRLFNGGSDDYLRIRVLDNGVPLEPNDSTSPQAFCSADSYATYKGNWVRRAGAGVHTLVVQFWIFDGAPAETVTAWIDDWTFELVVYD